MNIKARLLLYLLITIFYSINCDSICSQLITPFQSPNEAMNLTNYGVGYSIEGDYNKAISYYNKAIKHDPNHGLAYWNRGLAYYKLGEYRNALSDFKKCVKLDFSSSEAKKKITEINKINKIK